MLINFLPVRAFLKLVNFCYYRNYKNNRQDRDAPDSSTCIVLYDHECPFCRQEMQRLKSLDHEDRLILLNMNGPLFNEAYWGVSHEDASRALHVLTAEKVWLVGMPAIRHVYAQVGLGWLLAPTGWPLLSSLADIFYRQFASNRYAISHWMGLRKNDGQCTESVCMTNEQNNKS